MKKYKIPSLILLWTFAFNFTFAETSTLETEKANLQIKIENNLNEITRLQQENRKLKLQLIEVLKRISWSWFYLIDTNNDVLKTSSTANSNTWIIITQSWSIQKASENEKYNKLIEKINSSSWQIFQDNSLSPNSSIWLFEFIEPSNFFISIDDGNNPEWVTAFKKKILYSYDNDLNLKIEWIFELDYNSQYYITKFWKNPFAKTVRIRVKNPTYKWKLLDEDVSNTTSTSSKTTTNSTSTSSTSQGIQTSWATTSSSVTLDSIKTAYKNNKILDALKLSNEYIINNPDNIDVLKIRYRSYYMLWKYNEALVEIQKIEKLVWTDNLEKIVACDAKTTAKLAKNTELNTKYAQICASK